MNANHVAQTILTVLQKGGLSDSESRQVLLLVAEKLAADAQAEKLAKATRRGLSLDEADGFARGRALGATVNAKHGWK
jgi:hypothetical protein